MTVIDKYHYVSDYHPFVISMLAKSTTTYCPWCIYLGAAKEQIPPVEGHIIFLRGVVARTKYLVYTLTYFVDN
jgi:hypothetical protein